MATNEILQRLGEAVSRRRFIARTGSAFLGAAIAVLGLPQPASAHFYHYACCHLCHAPTSSPCGSRPPYCIWSWGCCYGTKRWRCTEWYCGGGDCDAGCENVNGSTVTLIGTC
jgi:hypothetical protein